MAFKQKTWKDRLVEFAGRRTLNRISGSADTQMVVDITRSEGTVSQEGDAFSAANMNDLEQRVADEFASLNSSLSDNGKQFRFGYDGDNDQYGYYKADDSFVPFSNFGNWEEVNYTYLYDPHSDAHLTILKNNNIVIIPTAYIHKKNGVTSKSVDIAQLPEDCYPESDVSVGALTFAYGGTSYKYNLTLKSNGILNANSTEHALGNIYGEVQNVVFILKNAPQ